MDTRREQIIDIVTREFIGPDPITATSRRMPPPPRL